MSSAPEKSRSYGASYTGFPPSMTSTSTAPARMSSHSSRSDSVQATGSAAIGSVNSTVVPSAPSAAFSRCPSACTAAGCPSPTTTSAREPARRRSRATASIQPDFNPLLVASASACASPFTAASRASAQPAIRVARSGTRWSAWAPVTVLFGSIAYRRFMPSGASRSRRAANSRA